MIDLTPSDYSGDPILRMASQLGHTWIGLAATLMLTWIWWPLWIAVPPLYAAWESRQYFVQRARLADCMFDAAFVGQGCGFGLAVTAGGLSEIRKGVVLISILILIHGFEAWRVFPIFRRK